MSTGNTLYSPSTGRALYSPSTGRALYSGVTNPFITHYCDSSYYAGLVQAPTYFYDENDNPRPAIKSDFWPQCLNLIYNNGLNFYRVTPPYAPNYNQVSWESFYGGGLYTLRAFLVVNDLSDVLVDYDYLRAIKLYIASWTRPAGSGQPMIGLILSDTLTFCTSLSCMESGLTHTINSTGYFTWQLSDLPLKRYLFLYQWIANFEIPTAPGTAHYSLLYSWDGSTWDGYRVQMLLV